MVKVNVNQIAFAAWAVSIVAVLIATFWIGPIVLVLVMAFNSCLFLWFIIEGIIPALKNADVVPIGEMFWHLFLLHSLFIYVGGVFGLILSRWLRAGGSILTFGNFLHF